MNRIFLIGAGNMAWQLGKALQRVGYSFAGVYSRTAENAELLAKELQCPAIQTLDLRQVEAQLFILCVPDGAMPEVIRQLQLPKGAALVHTSGSQQMALLGSAATVIGVFYPLQTVSKTKPVSFLDVPIFIETETPALLAQLTSMANAISRRVQVLSSEKRQRLHLAAVFACNFVNHQLAIADELLREDGLDISFLSHLIEETVSKAQQLSPKLAQTGPAIRHDHPTMAQHLRLLQAQPIWQEIYRTTSLSIQSMADVDG